MVSNTKQNKNFTTLNMCIAEQKISELKCADFFGL